MMAEPDRRSSPPRPFVDRLVVLDDDPTGAQTLSGIRVLLAWRHPDRIARALAGRRSVHVVTNTRALPPEQARATVAGAARAALRGVAGARLLLRGDSTLRGHLLERDGRAEPLHQTEYARDGVFAYSSARLLEWAEERSGGLFRAADGLELHLGELRARGAEALEAVGHGGRPAVLAPDAETDADLAVIAAGYAAALERGWEAAVRCAPAFAGVVAGTTAPGLLAPPRATGPLLVVCGSYVPTSTRQLAALEAAHPGSLV